MLQLTTTAVLLARRLAEPALRFPGLALQLAVPALRFPGLALQPAVLAVRFPALALTSSFLSWKQKTLPFAYPKLLVPVLSRVVSRRYWLPRVVVPYLLFPGVP